MRPWHGCAELHWDEGGRLPHQHRSLSKACLQQQPGSSRFASDSPANAVRFSPARRDGAGRLDACGFASQQNGGVGGTPCRFIAPRLQRVRLSAVGARPLSSTGGSHSLRTARQTNACGLQANGSHARPVPTGRDAVQSSHVLRVCLSLTSDGWDTPFEGS